MPPLRVLISGAGIAGNALAFWLSKLGHDVTVIERWPNLRVTGLQLDLRGHGIEVMRRMGLEQAFRAKSAPEKGLQIVDSTGRQRALFPANKSGKGLQNFTTDFEIMRGDLCKLLYDATKTRANFVFGSVIENFTDTGEAVDVKFSDGKRGQFDLVVGADGNGSRTRRAILGPNTPDAIHPLKGVYLAYFTIPRQIRESEQYLATIYFAPGKRFIMTRRHSPDSMQVYLAVKTDSKRLQDAKPGDVEAEKKALTEIFQGAGWQTEEILKDLKDNEDFYCERLGLVKLDSWSKGQVALVGDAAYCPTAYTGMGTTSSIVGAYILAGEIGKHCELGSSERKNSRDNLRAALEAYEDKFRPFMDQVQQGVSENAVNLPSSSFTIATINILMGIFSYLKVNVFGEWALKEKVRDWELPAYKEMTGK